MNLVLSIGVPQERKIDGGREVCRATFLGLNIITNTIEDRSEAVKSARAARILRDVKRKDVLHLFRIGLEAQLDIWN